MPKTPMYANFFVSSLEEECIYVSHHFWKVLGWWRYIDDIFLLWLGTEIELAAFHEFLNGNFPDIAFTLSWSKSALQFLDVNVKIIDGQLHTKLFTKETDRNTLLRYENWHPKKMLDSLPFSQIVRVRRIVDIVIYHYLPCKVNSNRGDIHNVSSTNILKGFGH